MIFGVMYDVVTVFDTVHWFEIRGPKGWYSFYSNVIDKSSRSLHEESVYWQFVCMFSKPMLNSSDSFTVVQETRRTLQDHYTWLKP